MIESNPPPPTCNDSIHVTRVFDGYITTIRESDINLSNGVICLNTYLSRVISMTILKTSLVIFLSVSCCISILISIIPIYRTIFPLRYNARLIGFVIKAFLLRRSKLKMSVIDSLKSSGGGI